MGEREAYMGRYTAYMDTHYKHTCMSACIHTHTPYSKTVVDWERENIHIHTLHTCLHEHKHTYTKALEKRQIGYVIALGGTLVWKENREV